MAGAGYRGGAETVLRTLLEHLTAPEFDSLVVLLQGGPLVDDLRRFAPVVTIPTGRLRHLGQGVGAVRQLARLFVEQHAAVVHCHGTGAQLYGGLAARVARVPHVFHVHDAPTRRPVPQGLLERAAFRIPADAVVAISRYVASRLPRRLRARVHVIPNGVEVPDEGAAGAVEATAIRRRFGWPAACPLVVWCGRLQRWKGTHVFLDAAASIARIAPDVRFLVVGGTLFGLEPGYEVELRRQHRRLGLGDTLVFAGQQADVTPFLAAATLLVHCAVRPEPFGLVLLEAMALGVPVVAAAAGGVLEIIEDGVSGVLVPPGDREVLARTVLDLLRDPARCQRIGRAGRIRVTAEFSAARMTRAIEELYRGVVARVKRAAA